MLKGPVVAYARVEPTRTGAALARRNFGRDARRKVIILGRCGFIF